MGIMTIITVVNRDMVKVMAVRIERDLNCVEHSAHHLRTVNIGLVLPDS